METVFAIGFFVLLGLGIFLWKKSRRDGTSIDDAARDAADHVKRKRDELFNKE